MKDGLPNSLVYRIFQDKKGFIWFCTDNGLSLYNGKTFHNYFIRDGLADDCVMSMSEDASGNKLISTYGGGISTVSNGTFANYSLPGFLDAKVIYAAAQGQAIWFIANSGGQCLFNVHRGHVKKLDIKNAAGQKVFFNKLLTHKNDIFFAATDGIYKVAGDSVQRLFQNIVHEKVYDVKIDSPDDYWVGMRNKVVLIKNNIAWKTYKTDGDVSNILVDKHRNVWVALAAHGILLIKDGVITDITSYLKLQRTIINDLIEDTEGNIWIATYNKGVYRINSLDIVNYFDEENNSVTYTKAIAPAAQNTLLLGSIGKINIWKNGSEVPVNFTSLKPDDYVYTVAFSDGKIYAGTPEGLCMKDTRYPCAENVIHPADGSGALSFFKDSRKSIWVGGYGLVYHLKNNTLVPDTLAVKILHQRRYNAIFEDHTGKMWFGTDSGLISFDGSAYSFQPLPPVSGINTINTIFEDSHHRIWVGTKSGLISLKNNQLRVFTVNDGLANNKCNAIAEDRNNTLWIGTANGLNYIDLDTLGIKTYRAGIYPSEVLSLYCKDDYCIFAGTSNGLSLIRTKDVAVSEKAPPLYITSIKTSNWHSEGSEEVKLPWNQNRLTIDFIGINYRNPDAVEYRYKIRKLDDIWHITRNTSIELPALPSGDYTLVLNARQNKGRWSDDVTLPISVATPLWRQPWFLLLFLSIAASAIYFITRWRTMKSEFKKRQQLSLYNKVIYLKQQALAALINPHFIFNSMNSIQHYLNNHDNDMANSYLADFAGLIRMTMDNAQNAFIGLHREIERIKLYLSLEQLRFGDDLQYKIVIDDSLNTDAIQIPNMILQPFIENAILHGIVPKNAPGNLLIRFSGHEDGKIKIVIEDDGVGIENRSEKKSAGSDHIPLGMKLTGERLHLLNELLGHFHSVKVKEAVDDKGRVAGTVVEIILSVTPRGVEQETEIGLAYQNF